MDNDFLPELATEVQRVAIHDQPLFFVEVVAEYEVDAWYFWTEIMIIFTTFDEEYCWCRKLQSF